MHICKRKENITIKHNGVRKEMACWSLLNNALRRKDVNGVIVPAQQNALLK